MKKLFILLSVGSLVLTGAANAQNYFTGSMAVADYYGGGSASAGTLTLFPTALITTAGLGDYAPSYGVIPAYSDLTAYTGTISGIGTSPTTENINDYLTFSTPDSSFESSGTTPSNRFEFDLSTLTYLGDGNGTYSFSGVGTLVDTTGYYANTPADMTISFSGPGSYSFTFASAAPVPEPATMTLFAGGLLGLLALRRRKA